MCDFIRGVTYKKPDVRGQPGAGYLPLLRATNVQRGLILDEDLVFVPERLVRDEQHLRRGDVVVATSSGSQTVVGKSAQLARDWKGTIGAFCGVLRAKPGISAEYVAHFAASTRTRQAWSAVASGTSINNLKPRDIIDTCFWLAPEAEQRRIALAIEEHLSRLDAADRLLCRAQKQLRQLQPALVNSLLFDGYPRRKFAEITINHDGRRVPVKAAERAKRRGPYPYYGASGVIDTIDAYIYDGDFLLIAEDGANLATRSKPIAFRASGRFWVNNHAHVVESNELTSLKYLELVINVTSVQHAITGTAQPKLTQASLNRLELPVPPVEEQQQIVSEVERQVSIVDAMERTIDAGLKRSATLRRAILDRAFRGTLVPHDPRDERASVLLERIAAAPGHVPKRRSRAAASRKA